MALLKTPGVFVEEISTIGPAVAPVATAIPAFLGFTTNHSSLASGNAGGTAKLPVRITSFKEYETIFGKSDETAIVEVTDTITGTTLVSRSIAILVDDSPVLTPTTKNKLYYHMQLYFSNGGGPCYIVSVGTVTDSISEARFTAGLDEIKLVDEPTLLVFPEAYDLGDTDHGVVIKNATAQAALLQDRFVIADINATHTNANTPENFRDDVNSVNNKYGALYFPALETTIKRTFTDAGITIKHQESIDGAALTDGAYHNHTLEEVHNGFTIVVEEEDVEVPPNTGLYNEVRANIATSTVTLPASAAIAGVYANVDNQRGVWKAPANVPLSLVVAPSVKLSDSDQEDLNVDTVAGISINAIRAFTGKGNIVWGARTMDGNSAEWRYINVRRLFIFIEESIQKAMQSYVFEPNTAQTWLRTKGTIDSFLTGLWRQGALAGAKADDAFFVKVGLGQTMTSDDILNGILNIEIGLAAARPAEFIVLKFSQTQQVS